MTWSFCCLPIQVQHQSLQAAAEEAAAAGGGFYRMDSGAALAAHGLGSGNPYGDLQQQANMLELLGLLRAVSMIPCSWPDLTRISDVTTAAHIRSKGAVLCSAENLSLLVMNIDLTDLNS